MNILLIVRSYSGSCRAPDSEHPTAPRTYLGAAILGFGHSLPTAAIAHTYAPVVAVGFVLGIAGGYVTSLLYLSRCVHG